MPSCIVLIGASSEIAQQYYQLRKGTADLIFRVSRNPAHSDVPLSSYTEDALIAVSKLVPKTSLSFELIVFNGLLHDGSITPEKTLRNINPEMMLDVINTNCVLPMLVLKTFMTHIKQSSSARIFAFSARVGSIGDNRLGGWFSYRMSKSALNQGFQCAAIELARHTKDLVCALYHPGTTITPLSEPYRTRTPANKLFDAKQSATYFLNVSQQLQPHSEAYFIDWQGKDIPW